MSDLDGPQAEAVYWQRQWQREVETGVYYHERRTRAMLWARRWKRAAKGNRRSALMWAEQNAALIARVRELEAWNGALVAEVDRLEGDAARRRALLREAITVRPMMGGAWVDETMVRRIRREVEGMPAELQKTEA